MSGSYFINRAKAQAEALAKEEEERAQQRLAERERAEGVARRRRLNDNGGNGSLVFHDTAPHSATSSRGGNNVMMGVGGSGSGGGNGANRPRPTTASLAPSALLPAGSAQPTILHRCRTPINDPVARHVELTAKVQADALVKRFAEDQPLWDPSRHQSQALGGMMGAKSASSAAGSSSGTRATASGLAITGGDANIAAPSAAMRPTSAAAAAAIAGGLKASASVLLEASQQREHHALLANPISPPSLLQEDPIHHTYAATSSSSSPHGKKKGNTAMPLPTATRSRRQSVHQSIQNQKERQMRQQQREGDGNDDGDEDDGDDGEGKPSPIANLEQPITSKTFMALLHDRDRAIATNTFVLSAKALRLVNHATARAEELLGAAAADTTSGAVDVATTPQRASIASASSVQRMRSEMAAASAAGRVASSSPLSYADDDSGVDHAAADDGPYGRSTGTTVATTTRAAVVGPNYRPPSAQPIRSSTALGGEGQGILVGFGAHSLSKTPLPIRPQSAAAALPSVSSAGALGAATMLTALCNVPRQCFESHVSDVVPRRRGGSANGNANHTRSGSAAIGGRTVASKIEALLREGTVYGDGDANGDGANDADDDADGGATGPDVAVTAGGVGRLAIVVPTANANGHGDGANSRPTSPHSMASTTGTGGGRAGANVITFIDRRRRPPPSAGLQRKPPTPTPKVSRYAKEGQHAVRGTNSENVEVIAPKLSQLAAPLRSVRREGQLLTGGSADGGGGNSAAAAAAAPSSSDLFLYGGDVMNGQRHGQGTFIMRGHAMLRGEFEGGELTGKGVMQWEDGSTYEGYFLEGEPHGLGGVYVGVSSGEYYEGGYQYGSRDGYGILKKHPSAKDAQREEEAYADKLRAEREQRAKDKAIGRVHFKEQQQQKASTNNTTAHQHQQRPKARLPAHYTYRGHFARGKLSDSDGLLIDHSTNSRMRGSFADGLPHGTITITSANGDVFEGQFEAGEATGDGTLICAQFKNPFTDSDLLRKIVTYYHRPDLKPAHLFPAAAADAPPAPSSLRGARGNALPGDISAFNQMRTATAAHSGGSSSCSLERNGLVRYQGPFVDGARAAVPNAIIPLAMSILPPVPMQELSLLGPVGVAATLLMAAASSTVLQGLNGAVAASSNGGSGGTTMPIGNNSFGGGGSNSNFNSPMQSPARSGALLTPPPFAASAGSPLSPSSTSTAGSALPLPLLHSPLSNGIGGGGASGLGPLAASVTARNIATLLSKAYALAAGEAAGMGGMGMGMTRSSSRSGGGGSVPFYCVQPSASSSSTFSPLRRRSTLMSEVEEAAAERFAAMPIPIDHYCARYHAPCILTEHLDRGVMATLQKERAALIEYNPFADVFIPVLVGSSISVRIGLGALPSTLPAAKPSRPTELADMTISGGIVSGGGPTSALAAFRKKSIAAGLLAGGAVSTAGGGPSGQRRSSGGGRDSVTTLQQQEQAAAEAAEENALAMAKAIAYNLGIAHYSNVMGLVDPYYNYASTEGNVVGTSHTAVLDGKGKRRNSTRKSVMMGVAAALSNFTAGAGGIGGGVGGGAAGGGLPPQQQRKGSAGGGPLRAGGASNGRSRSGQNGGGGASAQPLLQDPSCAFLHPVVRALQGLNQYELGSGSGSGGSPTSVPGPTVSPSFALGSPLSSARRSDSLPQQHTSPSRNESRKPSDANSVATSVNGGGGAIAATSSGFGRGAGRHLPNSPSAGGSTLQPLVKHQSQETGRKISIYLLGVPKGMDPYAVDPTNCSSCTLLPAASVMVRGGGVGGDVDVSTLSHEAFMEATVAFYKQMYSAAAAAADADGTVPAGSGRLGGGGGSRGGGGGARKDSNGKRPSSASSNSVAAQQQQQSSSVFASPAASAKVRELDLIGSLLPPPLASNSAAATPQKGGGRPATSNANARANASNVSDDDSSRKSSPRSPRGVGGGDDSSSPPTARSLRPRPRGLFGGGALLERLGALSPATMATLNAVPSFVTAVAPIAATVPCVPSLHTMIAPSPANGAFPTAAPATSMGDASPSATAATAASGALVTSSAPPPPCGHREEASAELTINIPPTITIGRELHVLYIAAEDPMVRVVPGAADGGGGGADGGNNNTSSPSTARSGGHATSASGPSSSSSGANPYLKKNSALLQQRSASGRNLLGGGSKNGSSGELSKLSAVAALLMRRASSAPGGGLGGLRGGRAALSGGGDPSSASSAFSPHSRFVSVRARASPDDVEREGELAFKVASMWKGLLGRKKSVGGGGAAAKLLLGGGGGGMSKSPPPSSPMKGAAAAAGSPTRSILVRSGGARSASAAPTVNLTAPGDNAAAASPSPSSPTSGGNTTTVWQSPFAGGMSLVVTQNEGVGKGSAEEEMKRRLGLPRPPNTVQPLIIPLHIKHLQPHQLEALAAEVAMRAARESMAKLNDHQQRQAQKGKKRKNRKGGDDDEDDEEAIGSCDDGDDIMGRGERGGDRSDDDDDDAGIRMYRPPLSQQRPSTPPPTAPPAVNIVVIGRD